jgi:hypothetical protein
LTRFTRDKTSDAGTDAKGEPFVTKRLIEFISMQFFGILLFCGTLSATAQTPVPVPPKPKPVVAPPVPVAPVNTIHDIDFQNFTYRPSCVDDDIPVRTRNGEYTRRQGIDRVFFKVDKVNYGDLTGDRVDEVIITSVCNTGGTGQFSEGFVFTMRDGRAVELTKIGGGDRAFDGINDARVERGLLVVERYAPESSGGGACCPKYIETRKYRWDGRRLVQVSRATRRAYEPA